MNELPDEPWKDKETLYGLYQGDGLLQKEIAEYFTENGHEVTAGTISYWIDKLEIKDVDKIAEPRNGEGIECVNYQECGNITCGPKNTLCTNCMDKRRGVVEANVNEY